MRAHSSKGSVYMSVVIIPHATHVLSRCACLFELFCVSALVHVRGHVHCYECLRVHIDVSMCVCVGRCVWVYVCVYVQGCVHVYVWAYVSCVRMRIHRHMHNMHMRVCICMCMCECVCIVACVCPSTHAAQGGDICLAKFKWASCSVLTCGRYPSKGPAYISVVIILHATHCL